MKTIILAIFLMILTATIDAQNGVVKGKIYDSLTNEGIPNALLFNKTENLKTISDINGFYIINAKKGDLLQLGALGYNDITKIIDSIGNFNFSITASNQSLDEVVVTANRSLQKRTDAPISIGKVSAKMIAETKPKDIFELLNKVSGVTMTNLNNEQHAMSIRQPMGNMSAYFLYLEDGIPIRTMGVFNHNALIELNIPAINSIEVVKGPASSLYGPEAVGGSVNFLMLKPTAIATFKVGVQADNYDYYRLNFSATGGFSKRLGYVVSINKTAQNNGWLLNSNYNKEAYSFRLDYKLNAKTLLWSSYNQVDYLSQMSGSIDSIAFYSRKYTSTTDFTYRDVAAKRARLTLEHNWNENSNTSITAYWRNNTINLNPTFTIRWTPGRDSAQNEVSSSKFNSAGFIAQHSTKLPFWNTKVLVGLSADNSPHQYDARRQVLNAQLRSGGLTVEKYTIRRFDENVFLTNYDAKLLNIGSWIQTEFNATKQLKAVVGIRYDKIAFDYTSLPTLTQTTTATGKKSYEQFSPRIAFNYRLHRNISLFANYAKGFVQANLSTLFNPINPQGLNLAPATFNSYELGGWASLIKNKLYIDITFYLNKGINEVVSIRQLDNSTIPTSTGRTLHQGVEYGLNYKPNASFNFRISATNALHKFEQFILSERPADALKNVNGFIMPSSPNFMGNAEITYKPSKIKGFRISAEWQYISSWYQNQVNDVEYTESGFLGAKGISLLNIRTGYTIKRMELFFNIYNATNELYANTATRGNALSDRTTYTAGAPRIANFGFQYTITGKK